jgi:hypothetical protein
MPSNKYLLIFLRAFINELLGRYVSLYQFVDRSRREAGGQATALLEEYSKKLNENVVRLLASLPTLYNLPVPDDQVDKNYLSGVFGTLIAESEEFQKTHRTLRWFSEPWPEAELFQFLKRVFKERSLEQEFEALNPSIVFHDVYNFLTYDIGYMQHSVNRADLDAWALPKSESSNPLLWTVLVHEVAHDIYDEKRIYEYLRDQIGSFPEYPEYDNHETKLLELLNLWSRELTADLFSFYVLGPAYLYSLIYFSVFFVRNDLRTPFLSETMGHEVWHRPSEDPRNLHPPPKDRIELLITEMSSLKLDRSPEHAECFEVFHSLFKARCEFDNEEGAYEHKDVASIALTPELMKRLWLTLKQMQKDVFPKKTALGGRDVRDATRLFKRLQEGELACALPRTERNLDKVREYIEESRPPVPESQPFLPRDNRPPVPRDVALDQLNEEPARMIDIINAGWMQKAKDSNWKEPIYRSEDKKERLLEWPQLLDALIEPSRQLQKSIQVALIISPLLHDPSANSES